MNRPPLAADIHRAIVEFAASGRPFALAVVLKTAGSAPRQPGTKAIIDSGGAIWGTVGGGLVEAETQRRAVEAIRSGRPLVFDFALAGTDAKDDRPICGGSMRILVDPTAADQRAVYAQAAVARRRRRRSVLVTTVRAAPPPRVTVEWFAEESVAAQAGLPGGEALRSALAAETAQSLVQDLPQEGGALEVLVEPLIPPPLLVIAGGGHIGQALALQAGLVGFDIVVIDDRSEFADAALFPPGAVTRCGDIARELADLPIAGDTYVVVVTRGHGHDKEALAACIRKPAAYIGMIGSRRKVALIRKDLLETGAATEDELRRVYAPIGLDIGAETVAEIAASIVAQLIAVRRTGSSPRMPIV
jgi:xanthine dehydrogenase accessory factor